MLSDLTKLYANEGVSGIASGAIRFARWRWHRAVDAVFYGSARLYYRLFHGGMRDVINEDWDNLLILDGCRFDLFKQANEFDADLDYRISKGPSTPRFLEANIQGEDLQDTVYVTANPQYAIKGLADNFHAVVPVWKTDWDDETKTVLPSAVFEAAKSAHDDYPDKRLLVHFMQPHYPFLGVAAEEIGDHAGIEASRRSATDEETSRDHPTVWELLERGDVDRDTVWNAYRETLEIVLPYAEQTAEYCTGKTVISSDHGNLIGEYGLRHRSRQYGHPHDVHSINLLKVPWLELEHTGRREYEATLSEGANEDVDTGVVEDRLRNLGYKV